jgi:hypothetical protein
MDVQSAQRLHLRSSAMSVTRLQVRPLDGPPKTSTPFTRVPGRAAIKARGWPKGLRFQSDLTANEGTRQQAQLVDYL